MTAPKVEVGNTYHRLTVIRLAGRCRLGNKHWIVKCDCNRIGEFIVAECAIRYESTKSCGCWREEVGRKNIRRAWATKHGHTVGKKNTSTYMIWSNMLKRCRNPNSKYYHNYGGRGITVCDRWLKFENFLADMGERPANLSLEREDNEKGYTPDNCKWATQAEQNGNRRRNVYVVIDGERLCFAQAARKWQFGMTNVRRLAKDENLTLQQATGRVLEKRWQRSLVQTDSRQRPLKPLSKPVPMEIRSGKGA